MFMPHPHEPVSRPEANHDHAATNAFRVRPDHPRLAALILLTAWTALGILQTGYVMIRPHGLVLRRSPELDRTIGLPAAEDGRAVVAALDLITAFEPPSGVPILILRPADADVAPWDYIHFQLAQLVYPRRVDLVAAGTPPPLDPDRYGLFLAPPGLAVDDAWIQLHAGPEFVLYQRSDGP